jgi:hypothetical protein
VIGNQLYKFDAGFFSSGKAAGSVDTGGINGFWQRGMMEKRQAKCKGYFQSLTKGRTHHRVIRQGVPGLWRGGCAAGRRNGVKCG